MLASIIFIFMDITLNVRCIWSSVLVIWLQLIILIFLLGKILIDNYDSVFFLAR